MFKIYLSALLLFVSTSVMACDLCNCYLGINPNYNQNGFGIRYRDRSYFGEHSHDNLPLARVAHDLTATSTSVQAEERYRTTELWTRWYPFKKLVLQASIPVSYNTYMVTGEAAFITQGLGDIIVLAQYQIYNTTPVEGNNFRQRAFIGGGIKLPTGAYNKKAEGDELDPHMQIGTGSVDYLTVATYIFKYKSLGYSADVTYKINTANSNDFQFANRLNVSGTFFYQKKIAAITLMSGAGLYYEQAGYDKALGVKQINTGGNALLVNTGLDTYFKRFSLNLVAQLPVSENLNGNQAKGQTRYIVGVGYYF
jgi:hypothetical protein